MSDTGDGLIIATGTILQSDLVPEHISRSAWYRSHDRQLLVPMHPGVSRLATRELTPQLAIGWQAAVYVGAIGPAAAAVMVLVGMPRASRAHPARAALLADVGRAWSNRRARAYIFGYAVHSWELFGSRSWIVAFLSFAQGASSQWLQRTGKKNRWVVGKVPFSTVLTQQRFTPMGISCSALHAMVQA